MTVDFSDVTKWEQRSLRPALRWERRADKRWIEQGEWVLSWRTPVWRRPRSSQHHTIEEAFAARHELPRWSWRHPNRQHVTIGFRDTSDRQQADEPGARDQLARYEDHQRVLLSRDRRGRSSITSALKDQRKARRKERP